MPMRTRLSVISTLILVGLAVGGRPSTAEAQFGKRLKDAVKRTAEDKAIQKATDAEGRAIDDALDLAFQVDPLSRALADQPDDIRAKAAAAVRSAFAKRPGDTAVQIDGAAWIVTARN